MTLFNPTKPVGKKRAAVFNKGDAAVYVAEWCGQYDVNLEVFGRHALTMTPDEAVLFAERMLWAARKARRLRGHKAEQHAATAASARPKGAAR